MSKPFELNQKFRQFVSHPDLSEVEGKHKKTFVVMNAFAGLQAMDTFCFAFCSFDQASGELYAVVKPRLNAGAYDGFFLSRSDLDEMQASVSELCMTDLAPVYSQFYERLNDVIGCALKEMDIHQKTVQEIYGYKPAAAPVQKMVAFS